MQIRISSEALRSGAERHRTILTAIDDAASDLNAQVSLLRQAWEGNAGAQAVQTLEEIKNYADKLTEATGEGVNKLVGFCEAFEAIDQGEQSAIFFRTLPTKPFINLVGCPCPTIQFPFFQPGSVRIVPEELRAVAAKCSAIADTYTVRADDLRNSLQILQNEWEGNSFNRFSEETMELVSVYTKIYEEIMGFSDRLRKAAMRYEEIDNMF